MGITTNMAAKRESAALKKIKQLYVDLAIECSDSIDYSKTKEGIK